MKITHFTELAKEDQDILKEAVARLPHSLNKVSNPQTSAVALTEKGRYFGNNIFLSNCTLSCAEANALSACVAEADRPVIKLYLAIGRPDAEVPKLISPCGNCRQMLHDFSRLNNNTIEILSTTDRLEEVMITDSNELLPEGFKSASLGKMAGEVNDRAG
jgi:cytidine deaminase